MSSLLDPAMALLAVPLLAAWTGHRARAITQRFPPSGQFVATRAGRLHLIDQGQGDLPVLFLHGASGTLRVWEPAIGRHLAGLGRTILVDRPGHGFSERKAGRGAASLAHQAGAMIDALDALDIGRVVVVAHSWAGALGTRLALDYPDRVAGLMLIAPVTHPWPGGISWYYTAASLPVIGPLFSWTVALPAGELLMRRSIDGVFAPQSIGADYSHEAGIPLVLRPRQFMANAEDCVALNDQVAAQAPRYGEIACPVTVISGDSDGVVWTHLHSLGMARDVPQTRLIILDNVGHSPHHASPERLVAEIHDIKARAAG
ncbi:alpha/beta hydrolase [Phreatobacter aquaticus]|uniref:Alpha/beta hydrolase n=1 Tax=Phreatobacter aquaticus TaxID=2570229 RepID=A0A4D7QMB3_9HYPH|nr:alpha/beta hydrolase [Phreatobacter aquaticus]QCK88385.1 alpha/beta hydrolase [Phreatobacter aquaticus]